MSKKSLGTARVTCAHPTAKHPFYHLRIQITLKVASQFTIKDVSVNGENIRDFFLYSSGRLHKSRTLSKGGSNVLVVRYGWLASESLKVAVAGSGKDGKTDAVIAASSRAPGQGGYWNKDWPYYLSIVCTETAGISRNNEPVHATLALYSDRVNDPVQELRIVRVDARTGEAQEIPSQVHSVEAYHHDEPDERYQPTTICEVAFSATVDAYDSQVFLAFYGNHRAPSPSYSTGLSHGGSGLGMTVANEFYNIKLSTTSGAIDEMTMKTGPGYTFEHHLETNGALHWNPGIYAPPRPWLHASDWDPPEHYEEMHGPVFSMTKRSGTMDHYPEAIVSVGYYFYDRVPWMLMTSTIEIKKDISVKALRNGEIVLNRELVDEFAWCEPDGSRGLIRIQDTPRHPRHGKELPYNTPWACFISRDHGCGLGMITVELAHFRNDGGICKTFRPYSYLQWGPWAYYARPLVYTFLSAGPGRLVPVAAGNIYYEKMALLPLELEEDRAGFRYLDQLHLQLKNPLSTHIVEDTDERVPKSWMAPVLVQEFEEM